MPVFKCRETLLFYLPTQFVPFPVKPRLHVHVNDPGGSFEQEALLLQLLAFNMHSSISENLDGSRVSLHVLF